MPSKCECGSQSKWFPKNGNGIIITILCLAIWFPIEGTNTTKSEVADISLYRGSKKNRKRRTLITEKYCNKCVPDRYDYYNTTHCSVIDCGKGRTNKALIEGKELPFCEEHKQNNSISKDNSKKCECGTHASYGIPGEKPDKCVSCSCDTDVRMKRDNPNNNRKRKIKKISDDNNLGDIVIVNNGNADDDASLEHDEILNNFDTFVNTMVSECKNETEI